MDLLEYVNIEFISSAFFVKESYLHSIYCQELIYFLMLSALQGGVSVCHRKENVENTSSKEISFGTVLIKLLIDMTRYTIIRILILFTVGRITTWRLLSRTVNLGVGSVIELVFNRSYMKRE